MCESSVIMFTDGLHVHWCHQWWPSCLPLSLVTPSGECVNHQSSLTPVIVRYNKSNIPCQCGYPDGMSPLGKMVFPRALPSGKPSSLGETFHQDTHTGMAYLYNVHRRNVHRQNVHRAHWWRLGGNVWAISHLWPWPCTRSSRRSFQWHHRIYLQSLLFSLIF